MAHKINWTKQARKQFNEIVSYLESEWSERTAVKFVKKANEIFELLSIYPEAGSNEIRKLNIRGFLISKQVKVFYELLPKEILLINFFDNRLNPDKKLKKYK